MTNPPLKSRDCRLSNRARTLGVMYVAHRSSPDKARQASASPRRAGDPLGCECPVCKRVDRIIDDLRQSEEVSESASLGISEDVLGRPEYRPVPAGPDLHQSISVPLFARECGVDSFILSAHDHNEQMAGDKRRRLYVVLDHVWTADGRFL